MADTATAVRWPIPAIHSRSADIGDLTTDDDHGRQHHDQMLDRD